jgi:2-oxoglutarate dehydrogenase E1 component
MSSQYEFHGPNVGYILELYDRYLNDPTSLDTRTQDFFASWQPPSNGHAMQSMVVDQGMEMQKVVGALNYAHAIRQYGHLAANLDPLGNPSPGDPELDPAAHGITIDDLRAIPASFIGGHVGETAIDAYEATEMLKDIYIQSIGVDNDHIRIPEERQWLRDAIESRRYRFEGTAEEATELLERLTQIEQFEHFLQRSFPSKYRFSVEGLDMMVPLLDELIGMAAESGIETAVLAMAHRGRLNVLAHIMNKPYQKIFADFKDPVRLQEMSDAIGWTVGDVKYHKGVSRRITDESGETSKLTVMMPPNPSHLEFVNPVAVGMARAVGTKHNHRGEPHFEAGRTMQILIHGDAAFPGQGIVAETFNLSKLPGYWAGGSIHIIANNQLGFTTMPEDGRSTLYASDLAKGFKVPIVHVNADDPAACIEVARIAFAYQSAFEKDFLIDLVGYRRYGHNELDEPGFTQPEMYQDVREHPSVRNLWANKLVTSSIINKETSEQLVTQYSDMMQAEYDALEEDDANLMDPQPEDPPPGAAKKISTAISKEQLIALNDGLTGTLEGFEFYSSRFEKNIRSRRTALNDFDKPAIDWAGAEEFAFASILAEGIPIRLTGQDSERGTFSHRHSVLHHKETGAKLTPLQVLPQAQATFEVRNSPLSEAAVLAFEYGYNVQSGNVLVLWEAQYGDFANGAQVIIDEFVTSAREKWGQVPSMVMLLPHGHEGAGPDHSSGRVERFLALAAKKNMRIANCTTSAQYFHLLRRQALLLQEDPLPLVVMSPKSLLRSANALSSGQDLVGRGWQPVIDDPVADADQVKRLVFVSGKFYYDLVESEWREKHPDVAVVRIEQLYPFPDAELKQILTKYTKVKQIVWAQEEPKNMGAWEFMGYRLKKLVGINLPVNYVGRRRSSSPAEGSKTAHSVNQAMITEYAFNWKFR